ncbi:hypothetical protein ACHAXM_009454 [Skeletonema potamos]
MGQCCSFCKRFLPSSVIELSGAADGTTTDESLLDNINTPQVHSINHEMSAPSIEVANDLGNEVKGYGLALTDVSVEQESCYWEWRVRTGGNSTATVMVGVSNKRNSTFYEILASSSVPPEQHGTKFMCTVSDLKDGDVIGVVVQQSELPMIQLFVNGEVEDGLQVTRFRGTVFPSIYLPQQGANNVSASFLYTEEQFIHGPPGPQFHPLIAERSLM